MSITTKKDKRFFSTGIFIFLILFSFTLGRETERLKRTEETEHTYILNSFKNPDFIISIITNISGVLKFNNLIVNINESYWETELVGIEYLWSFPEGFIVSLYVTVYSYNYDSSFLRGSFTVEFLEPTNYQIVLRDETLFLFRESENSTTTYIYLANYYEYFYYED